MYLQGTVLDAGEMKANKMDIVFILTELTVYREIWTTVGRARKCTGTVLHLEHNCNMSSEANNYSSIIKNFGEHNMRKNKTTG